MSFTHISAITGKQFTFSDNFKGVGGVTNDDIVDCDVPELNPEPFPIFPDVDMPQPGLLYTFSNVRAGRFASAARIELGDSSSLGPDRKLKTVSLVKQFLKKIFVGGFGVRVLTGKRQKKKVHGCWRQAILLTRITQRHPRLQENITEKLLQCTQEANCTILK